MDTGFDFKKIRAKLDAEAWEIDEENPANEMRAVWLGTIFGITPSGKFYTPFANSNVAGDCEACKGIGFLPVHAKRRVLKRWATRHRETMRRWEARYGDCSGLYGRDLSPHETRAKAWIGKQPKLFRMRTFSPPVTVCCACDGLGSRSAALDARFNEALDREAEAIGASVMHLDDSIFIAEYRDAQSDAEESECVAN